MSTANCAPVISYILLQTLSLNFIFERFKHLTTRNKKNSIPNNYSIVKKEINFLQKTITSRNCQYSDLFDFYELYRPMLHGLVTYYEYGQCAVSCFAKKNYFIMLMEPI